MNGYVEHIPMMYHPGMQRNGGPYGYEYGSGEFIAPLTAGLIGAGLGFIGGGLLAGRPPGFGYGPGPFYGPGYGYGPGFYPYGGYGPYGYY